MSASFRSHFKPSSSQDRTIPKDDRKANERLATKSSSTDNKSSSSGGAQNVSRLAKRPSRRTESTEVASHGSSGTARRSSGLTAANNTSAVTTKPSATPPSEVAQAQYHKRASLRQDSHLPRTIRTPSLVSGSSTTTFDSPRTNGLRRKPSNLDRRSAHGFDKGSGIDSEYANRYNRDDRIEEAFEDSVLGISLPTTSKISSQDSHRRIYTPSNAMFISNGDGAYQTTDFTPPVPGFSQSATPSSRYTDSPFSHAPTPSSVSSYSPSVYVTGGTPMQQPPSPLRSRPSIKNRPIHYEDTTRLGLPAVRESSTSSSNSTVVATKSQPRQVSRKTASPATSDLYSRPTKSSSARSTATVEKSSSSRSKPSVAPKTIPPELAHLNVDPPLRPQDGKAYPPTRPSRNNTPSLTDLQSKSAIVQSDLPRLYTTYHKRTSSQETPVTSTSPSLRSRFGFSPRSASRQESPRVDSAISASPSAGKFVRGVTPDNTGSTRPRLLRKDSPVVSTNAGPSPSKSSRFGFLSRKARGETATPTEKPKRASKKGPAAGTGHEYYGRFAFRGRSGSNSSSTGFGRSPSADSNASSNSTRPSASRQASSSSKSEHELDDFLRERLNPVVLRGNGSTSSNHSRDIAPKMQESSSSVSLESLSQPKLLPSAMSSERGMSPAKHLPSSHRISSDSSEDNFGSKLPTLAVRRSLNRLNSDNIQQVRVPPPIKTNFAAPASISSYDAETSAWPQTDSTLPPEESRLGKEGLWLRPQKSEPAVQPARRWNFFERTHPTSHQAKRLATEESQKERTATPDPSFHSMAHYAMLDPPEPVGLEELDRIIREPESSTEDEGNEVCQRQKAVPYQLRHVGLLPSPVEADFCAADETRAESTPPRVMLHKDSAESPELLRARTAMLAPMAHMVDIPRSPRPEDQNLGLAVSQGDDEVTNTPALSTPEMPCLSESPRQPRLSPIGRIPHVVSRRDRDRRLPDNSFSRPFANSHPRPSVRPPGTLYNQIRDLASPIESGSQPVSSTSGRSESASTLHQSSINTDTQSSSTNRTSADFYAGNEFMSFAPRKNSELTYSSSSGNGSWVAPVHLHRPQDEDVWNEYNDLMDDVITIKTPLSSGSSFGAPFQYADMLQGNPSPSVPAPLNFGKPPSQQPTTALPLPPNSHNQQLPTLSSQVSRFLRPSLSPLTPDTLSHFVGAYGDRSSESFATQDRQSTLQDHRFSVQVNRMSTSSSRYSRASGHSRSASLPEANGRHSHASLAPSTHLQRGSHLLDVVESEADISSSETNLRLGALLTSKWLSFGRVLFSPAHNEMRLSAEPRVLVVDGLGDDWSQFVALSYPNASVYNLGSSAHRGSNVLRSSAEWGTSGNHRHINHATLSAPFPFPKGFFGAVVFRFPVASTDEAYQACIFECKRVLRPGGHLEVAVLDLDLMNMGTRTRRAVRGLKTRMQARDSNVSLRNMSDVLVRLIGRRGFEDVQRCVVGVPAAGRIPRSQDMSSSSSTASGRRPSWDREERVTSQELNFADLLQDNRGSRLDPDKTNDESITKMVAKVGRFWYTSCYEKALLETDKSIWSEPGLLRECVRQGTSFRLLICCAQKPTQARRRTVSV